MFDSLKLSQSFFFFAGSEHHWWWILQRHRRPKWASCGSTTSLHSYNPSSCAWRNIQGKLDCHWTVHPQGLWRLVSAILRVRVILIFDTMRMPWLSASAAYWIRHILVYYYTCNALLVSVGFRQHILFNIKFWLKCGTSDMTILFAFKMKIFVYLLFFRKTLLGDLTQGQGVCYYKCILAAPEAAETVRKRLHPWHLCAYIHACVHAYVCHHMCTYSYTNTYLTRVKALEQCFSISV
jgi:hypothetical protein